MKCGDFIKTAIKNRAFCFFTVLMMLLQIFAVSVSADGNVLSIYKNNPAVNQPFKVENMFPGDYITKKYQIDVSYKGDIIVYFTAEVRDEFEKLAEVLRCKVVMPDGTNYDVLLKDIKDFSHSLNAGKNGVTDSLNYEITAYLDTSVGNEYQGKKLIADFRWYAYTATEGGDDSGEDDDDDEGGGTGNGYTGSGGGIGVIPPPTGTVKPDEKPDDTQGGPTEKPDGEDEKDSSDISEGTGKPDTPQDDEYISLDEPTQKPKDEETEAGRPTGELIAPKTGDTLAPLFWILGILISGTVIFLIVVKRKKNDDKEEVCTQGNLAKKLSACIVIIVILALCLCATTFALVYSMVSVENNIFRTGEVNIEIYNDKKETNPIIKDDEFLLEPGMTIVKSFYVKNNSTDPNGIWYKVYFDNVSGGLASVLDVKITDKEKNVVLYNDKAINLTREKTLASEFVPGDDAWRELSLEFHYPEESGNDTQNAELTFEVIAEASQKSNNDGKEFS